jgi:hypothetical protein
VTETRTESIFINRLLIDYDGEASWAMLSRRGILMSIANIHLAARIVAAALLTTALTAFLASCARTHNTPPMPETDRPPQAAQNTTAAAGTDAELRLRRLDITDAEGNVGFILAARPRLPGIRFEGKQHGPGSRKDHPGMIFYNNNGDEVGGLVAMATKSPEGYYNGGISFSIDQVGHDGQVASLMNWTEGDYARTALRINDFPAGINPGVITSSDAYKTALAAARAATTDEEREIKWRAYFEMLGRERFYAERIFLGSEGAAERTAKLELKDSMSRPRLRMLVDGTGEPRIEFLDTEGKIVKTITAKP